jgi:hypothetical protein
MSTLSVEQQTTLQSFREIAQIEDEYLCIQIVSSLADQTLWGFLTHTRLPFPFHQLQQNSWNLEMSLNHFVSGEPEAPSNDPEGHSDETDDSGVSAAALAAAPTPSQPAATARAVAAAAAAGSAAAAPAVANAGGLLDYLLYPLSFLGTSQAPDPSLDKRSHLAVHVRSTT